MQQHAMRAAQLKKLQAELEAKAADASKGAGLRQLKQVMVRLAKGETAMRLEIWRMSVKMAAYAKHGEMQSALESQMHAQGRGAGLRMLRQVMARQLKGELGMRIIIWQRRMQHRHMRLLAVSQGIEKLQGSMSRTCDTQSSLFVASLMALRYIEARMRADRKPNPPNDERHRQGTPSPPRPYSEPDIFILERRQKELQARTTWKIQRAGIMLIHQSLARLSKQDVALRLAWWRGAKELAALSERSYLMQEVTERATAASELSLLIISLEGKMRSQGKETGLMLLSRTMCRLSKGSLSYRLQIWHESTVQHMRKQHRGVQAALHYQMKDAAMEYGLKMLLQVMNRQVSLKMGMSVVFWRNRMDREAALKRGDALHRKSQKQDIPRIATLEQELSSSQKSYNVLEARSAQFQVAALQLQTRLDARLKEQERIHRANLMDVSLDSQLKKQARRYEIELHEKAALHKVDLDQLSIVHHKGMAEQQVRHKNELDQQSERQMVEVTSWDSEMVARKSISNIMIGFMVIVSLKKHVAMKFIASWRYATKTAQFTVAEANLKEELATKQENVIELIDKVLELEDKVLELEECLEAAEKVANTAESARQVAEAKAIEATNSIAAAEAEATRAKRAVVDAVVEAEVNDTGSIDEELLDRIVNLEQELSSSQKSYNVLEARSAQFQVAALQLQTRLDARLKEQERIHRADLMDARCAIEYSAARQLLMFLGESARMWLSAKVGDWRSKMARANGAHAG